ncbi:molybdopterin biosynthesis protein [Pelotomaculum propionicicum]|uniref:Molybdopterin molybdenumtransferase n=1 Tax=Pelotomaculum propionicicum TaxID=258475 RepID=A0A4Y7RYN7_9FIRM|nr:molybdopterin biosynthesis protein [Pelotomaculum propionicicum]NLI14123.1 molybdopterin biosynthesis protein [Peptococcaceae bacterium]TEB13427.1 Molybdopterin molybdenumtransferase 2 [Pelotomaculum propionicicum]
MKRTVYLDDLPWEAALEKYLSYLNDLGALNPGRPELVPAEEALGRVAAAPVYARISSPHYHASAMDGLAVRSYDTYGAFEISPKKLRVGREAFPVDTGDPLPEGCDAVIMIEDVHYVQPDLIEIIHAAPPWQHVRFVGEDIVATEMIIPANHLVRPVDIGALLAGGVDSLYVHPRPRVALMPTGTELVQPGTDLKPGDIIEYNSRMLGAMVESWGGKALRKEITADDFASLKATLASSVDEADIVLINAGSSSGSEDFTADAIRALGSVLVHGVATKPGKPVILGEIKGKPVIGVPGYPVSAYMGLDLFVKPVIFRKMGTVPPPLDTAEATVSRKMVSSVGVEEFVRVKLGQVGDKVVATPIARGAGVLMSLVRADGVIRIPRLSEGYNAGDTATVELFRTPREIRETTVIIGSHDNSLDVLANFLRLKYPEATLSSAHVGSLGGLTALRRGEAHCAGTHLLDEETGEYNINYVKRILPDRKVALVNLVYREQGLILARGNPKGIHELADLRRDDVSFVNRQRGAGTRILLDYLLGEKDIAADLIRGYDHEEYTHMAVAVAVKAGAADAGLGIRAAAIALDLDFVSIVEERYDLCIPLKYMDTPYIQRLLAVMALPEFQAEVKKLGGYDLRDCGKVMWRS